MTNPTRSTACFLVALFLSAAAVDSVALADDDEAWKKLPPGPIRDRIELMEKIGADAKAINDAIKAGTPAEAAAPADNIVSLMPKFDALFPEGSTAEESRAKKNIWAAWDEFEAFSSYLKDAASEVATAARDGGDVKAASRKMFKSCKSCHKKFRLPKDDE
ncbi:MAG: cytochrome c [Candidatus Binatia bacterium]|nr:cytochrome c [Candidatus Binatia bacterium]